MRKQKENPTLGNILKLFSKRLAGFRGESRRSYRKAFSSFQIFTVSNYDMSSRLDSDVIGNWMIDSLLQGLSLKTVNFYLDKVASLYHGIADKISGGRAVDFKDLKSRLKDLQFSPEIAGKVQSGALEMRKLKGEGNDKEGKISFLESVLSVPLRDTGKEDIRFLWASLAFKAGIKAEKIAGVIGPISTILPVLGLVNPEELSASDREELYKTVVTSLWEEETKWYAMRLRPKVKYEDILERFKIINTDISVPELFYPCQEIARRVGRKVVWKGKPVIRDIVFFKFRHDEIYSLFTHIYDLAWCYRQPGKGNYASIPEKAMEDFKKALGMFTTDYDVSPAGEMELRPGDKVIIVNGTNVEEYGEIIKKALIDEDGNKIYRVTLLNSNGRWDIGIDARLLRPLK